MYVFMFITFNYDGVNNVVYFSTTLWYLEVITEDKMQENHWESSALNTIFPYC